MRRLSLPLALALASAIALATPLIAPRAAHGQVTDIRRELSRFDEGLAVRDFDGARQALARCNEHLARIRSADEKGAAQKLLDDAAARLAAAEAGYHREEALRRVARADELVRQGAALSERAVQAELDRARQSARKIALADVRADVERAIAAVGATGGSTQPALNGGSGEPAGGAAVDPEEAARLAAEAAALTEALAEARAALEASRAALAEAQAETAAETQAVQAEVAALRAELQALAALPADARASIAASQEAAQAEARAALEAAQALRAEIETAKAARADDAKALAAAREAAQEAGAEAAALRAEVERERAALAAELDATRKELAAARQDAQTTGERLGQLRGELATAAEEDKAARAAARAALQAAAGDALEDLREALAEARLQALTESEAAHRAALALSAALADDEQARARTRAEATAAHEAQGAAAAAAREAEAAAAAVTEASAKARALVDDTEAARATLTAALAASRDTGAEHLAAIEAVRAEAAALLPRLGEAKRLADEAEKLAERLAKLRAEADALSGATEEAGRLREELDKARAGLADAESLALRTRETREALSGAQTLAAELEAAKAGLLAARGEQAGKDPTSPEAKARLAPDGLPLPSFLEAIAGEPLHYLNQRDQGVYVWVPGGAFRLGTVGGPADEQPVREVTLRPFFLSKHEVSNARYARFLAALAEADGVDRARLATLDHPRQPAAKGDSPFARHLPGSAEPAPGLAWQPDGTPPTNREGHPVVLVDWWDAYAYARWVGGALPTEAQMEYAASYTGSSIKRAYPWGQSFERGRARVIADIRADLATAADRDAWLERTQLTDRPAWRILPPGSIPIGQSLLGFHDLAGNAAEWCLDVYDPAFYAVCAERDPLNEGGADADSAPRAVRGGSWASLPEEVRTSRRAARPPGARADDLGFRVAISR